MGVCNFYNNYCRHQSSVNAAVGLLRNRIMIRLEKQAKGMLEVTRKLACPIPYEFMTTSRGKMRNDGQIFRRLEFHEPLPQFLGTFRAKRSDHFFLARAGFLEICLPKRYIQVGL